MSEEMLVRHCSPTLAGMKTGNMFSCSFADVYEMCRCIVRWKSLLGKKGLSIIVLKFENSRALVYVYRASRLFGDLQHNTACELLHNLGYSTPNPEQCIFHLIKRLSECEEFPHEIGLFLGYPPEDVFGFIENKAENCKCEGCWKVYGDANAAQKIFEKYRKCTAIYCAQFAKGKSIEYLTVSD